MKQILITACNHLFFKSCLTLISSIHQHSFNTVNEIYVYDIGLNNEERQKIMNLEKVTLIMVNKLKYHHINWILSNINNYAWKPLCIFDAQKYGDLILYLDSGIVTLENIQRIYDLIEKDDIFLVQDKNWYNKQWAHYKCIDIMEVTDKELNDWQICAGIIGHKVGGKFQPFINLGFKFSQNKECISGYKYFHYSSVIEGHRHDQAIFAILASRFNCPTQSLEKYGEYRSLSHATQQRCPLYVHRNRYITYNHLRDKN